MRANRERIGGDGAAGGAGPERPRAASPAPMSEPAVIDPGLAAGGAQASAASGDALGAVALRGALASLVGGVVLEAVWGATARALAAPPTGAEGAEPAGVPCPPGTMEPTPCDPRGVAAWGAVYGALQGRVRAPTIVHGLLLGVLVHAASSAGLGVVPRATPRNGSAGRRQSGAPVVAHVAYGLATAATYEALR